MHYLDMTSLVPACTITVWTEGWTSRRAGISSIKPVVLPPDTQYVTAPGSFTNLMTESQTIQISGRSVSGLPL